MLALGAEKYIGLNELMPFPFQLLLSLHHPGLYLLLVGITFELIELLLGLHKLLLVLLHQLSLLPFEVPLELVVELLNSLVKLHPCLQDLLCILLFYFGTAPTLHDNTNKISQPTCYSLLCVAQHKCII